MPDTEMLDSTDIDETDVVDEGAVDGDQSDVVDEVDETEEPVDADVETPKPEAPEENYTVTKEELNQLVRVMAAREQAQLARDEQEQRKAQTDGKPKYVSAWDRDPGLAKIKTASPDVFDATNRQVRAAAEDFLHEAGVPLHALKHIVEQWSHLEGHVYRNEFQQEARQAAQEIGLTDEQMSAADKYAQEQWKKGRSGDYMAMFSEFSVKEQRKQQMERARAEKAGKAAKQHGRGAGDTGPATRGGGGEKVYTPSKVAEAAMAQGDMTVMMEEMRKQRGLG